MRTTTSHKVTVTAQLDLDEEQLRALDALTGYGFDAFLNQFYKLGRVYMEPHVKGLRRLFDSFDKVVKPALHEIDTSRRLMKERDRVARLAAEERRKG